MRGRARAGDGGFFIEGPGRCACARSCWKLESLQMQIMKISPKEARTTRTIKSAREDRYEYLAGE